MQWKLFSRFRAFFRVGSSPTLVGVAALALMLVPLTELRAALLTASALASALNVGGDTESASHSVTNTGPVALAFVQDFAGQNSQVSRARVESKKIALGAFSNMDERGSASGNAFGSITSSITLDTTLLGGDEGQPVTMTSRVNISGTLADSRTGNTVSATSYIFAILIDGTEVYSTGASKRNGAFLGGDIPGQVDFTFQAYMGVPYRQEFRARVTTSAGGISGSAEADAEFENSFTWGGIGRIVYTSTGVEVTDYTLRDVEGVNWATPYSTGSPAAVPEPSSLIPFGCGALGLLAGCARRLSCQSSSLEAARPKLSALSVSCRTL